MSYSFRSPEQDPTCECKYDAVRDRMDRRDCPFHYDIVDDPEPADEAPGEQPDLVEKDEPVVMAYNGPEDCEGLEAGMKIQYDREADVLSILLSESPVGSEKSCPRSADQHQSVSPGVLWRRSWSNRVGG
jgi:hypothetical protein